MQPVAQGATGSFRLKVDPAFRGRIAVLGRDADGARKWVRHLSEGDAKGHWLVEGVPVGSYHVTVLATGKVPQELAGLVITSNHRPTHEITLTDGGGIDLKVEGPDGKLLEKVHILLQDASGKQIDVQIFTEVSSGRAFVSVNYLPTIAAAKSDSGLAPGSYTLRAGKEGYAPAETEFSIAATEVAAVTLKLVLR